MAYQVPVLTQEQMAEFPGELLGRLAQCWLEFQHSSPCTTTKTAFQYFTAPKSGDMAEDDVLFGPDRELAYKKLIHALRSCQRARALDRYFDAAHSKFYEARTMPGFVLLSEWAHELEAQGIRMPGLYTGSFRDIRPEEYDQVWLIVRGLKAMPKNPLGNVTHVPLLSPSKKLWYHYLDLKKAGQWDQAAFQDDYAVAFLKEMLEPEPYAKLKELAVLTKTQAVLCACYCTDESLCHRSLIKKIHGVLTSP